MTINILGVGASLRKQSNSTAALKITLDLAKKYGAQIRLLNLRETKLPLYKTENGSGETEIHKVEEDVNWADAFILASPDYHGSMSGSMKNFLDYFWTEFAGKLFGYICSSHEKGLTVMDHMRTAVRQCYGWSMPYGISIQGGEDFDVNGKIANDELSQRLEMLARDLVVYGELVRTQFTRDLRNNLNETFASRYRK
ncbi:MAG TPA: NAD(P)H-dependent oxidoreductase [Nitrosopumilaceae archaeon]|nr:NAD(P)H-dependent oxidoreductase [Nitrosopumilaceae archaeon]